MMVLLDEKRRARIVNDVNELLFLWMAAIDETAWDSPQANASEKRDLLAGAKVICEKALVWAEPKGPWRALEAGLRASPTGGGAPLAGENEHAAPRRFNEPRFVNGENTALECFQWGILAYRDGRLSRAIEWLERASRLEGGSNYWYQFLLGYLEDKDGRTDDAFRSYNIACALRTGSPWALFSRGRLFTGAASAASGTSLARTSKSALEQLENRPEATQSAAGTGVSLSAGGRFRGCSRAEYNSVIRNDRSGVYARAARLNRANMDVELGAVESASASMMQR